MTLTTSSVVVSREEEVLGVEAQRRLDAQLKTPGKCAALIILSIRASSYTAEEWYWHARKVRKILYLAVAFRCLHVGGRGRNESPFQSCRTAAK
jgi:hypothetical protein